MKFTLGQGLKKQAYQARSQHPHKIAWIQDTHRFLHLHGSWVALFGGVMAFDKEIFNNPKNDTEQTIIKTAIL